MINRGQLTRRTQKNTVDNQNPSSVDFSLRLQNLPLDIDGIRDREQNEVRCDSRYGLESELP